LRRPRSSTLFPYTTLFRSGIIGAGGSGILAATALRRRGIPFELLEARDGVGGTWRYDPDGTGSAAYASLVMNTSKLATSPRALRDRKSTRLNSSHVEISYA